MPDINDELRIILQLSDPGKRDDELFAFVERTAPIDPDSSLTAANSVGELYKRGWALLLCVKALVHTDMEKAEEVAATIEDEYNKLRAHHTIEFTKLKHRSIPGGGGDPSWN
jgi:hypothetical protein